MKKIEQFIKPLEKLVSIFNKNDLACIDYKIIMMTGKCTSTDLIEHGEQANHWVTFSLENNILT